MVTSQCHTDERSSSELSAWTVTSLIQSTVVRPERTMDPTLNGS